MQPENRPPESGRAAFDFGKYAGLFGAFGVSGREGPIRRVLEERVRALGLDLLPDTTGSLIGRRRGGGQGRKILICAPMDTSGLMVTHIDEQGFARFSMVGRISVRALPGSRVRFENGAAGVVGIDSGARDSQPDRPPSTDRMFIDVGASTREEAVGLISVGETCALDAPPVPVGGVLFGAGARACCVVLLEVAGQIGQAGGDLYFLFAAQGELDLRGAATAAFRVQPDLALMVGPAACTDLPPAGGRGSVRLGGGAAVKVMDGGIIVPGQLVERLGALARASSIPFQMEVSDEGRRPANRVQLSGGGVLTGGVSLPVRHRHTAGELCAVSDLRACIGLAGAFCRAG